MTIYAVGDIQGCYEPLQRLLARLEFDETKDQLWFAGDLVNRGPDSLATLRFVKSLGDAAVNVLGNHDIHLLAIYYGLRPTDKDPTLTQVLEAPDADELITWLQQHPLLHVQNDHVLVHAGIHPEWDMQTAADLAQEIENTLRSVESAEDMAELYGPTSGDWKAEKQSDQRLRFALNCFTRMRYCTKKSILDFKHSCAPGEQPHNLIPWFDVANRKAADSTIIFGHWAALGVKVTDNLCALDSGCVWGNALTAINLTDMSLHQVPCPVS